MTVPLRDFFAAHVAAALSPGGGPADGVASRAYDVAEALLRERSFRDALPLDRDEPAAWADEDVGRYELEERDFARPGLLDEPAPMSDPDPSWDDRDFDPRWEAEPHWSVAPSESPDAQAPISDRPGIRSTRPERVAEEAGSETPPGKEHRSA